MGAQSISANDEVIRFLRFGDLVKVAEGKSELEEIFKNEKISSSGEHDYENCA